jgi:hypothetical protein
MLTRLCTLVLFCAALGCGDSGPPRASAGGVVKLDGQAIEEGSITFVPAEGTSGPTSGARITAGKYNIPKADGPLIGRSKVEIRAWRKTGRQIPNPMSAGALMDEKVEAFPEHYNSASTLVEEIVAGHNVLDFDLKSDPPPP